MTDKKIRIIFNTAEAKSGANEINQATKNIGGSADKATFSINKLAAAIATVVSVQKVAAYADAWTRVENQLIRTTKSQEDLAATSIQLLNVANSTRAALEPTVELYTSLSVSTAKLGVTQQQVIGVTQTINNLFLESGKGAAETAGAIRQLGQALESGALRGDEFNSVAEGAPGILRAVEKQTGLTRAELRDLAAQGKITAELLVTSLQNYQQEAQNAADKTSTTLGQSFDVAGNNFTYLIGRLDSATGASNGLAEAIISVTNAIANPKTLNNLEAFGKIIGIGIGQTVQRVSAELRYFGKIVSDPFDGEARAEAWKEFQQDIVRINEVTSDSIDILVAEAAAIEKNAAARRSAAGSGPSSPSSAGGSIISDDGTDSARAAQQTAILQAELATRIQSAEIYRENILSGEKSLYDQQLALLQIAEVERNAQLDAQAVSDSQRRLELLNKQIEDERLAEGTKILLKAEFAAQEAAAAQILEQQKTQVLQEGIRARMDLEKAEHDARIANVGTLGDSIMQISASKSKGIFKIGQALSLASAAAALPSAVVQSFQNGGGYPWGLVPAGAMLATGLKQIQGIKDAGKGLGAGGGNVSVPSISGAGGVGSTPSATASQTELTQQRRIIDVRGIGPDSLLTGEQFKRIMEEDDSVIIAFENAKTDARRRNVVGAG